MLLQISIQPVAGKEYRHCGALRKESKTANGSRDAHSQRISIQDSLHVVEGRSKEKFTTFVAHNRGGTTARDHLTIELRSKTMQRLGRLQASYFHPGCYGLGK
jgi:hypothetical protein